MKKCLQEIGKGYLAAVGAALLPLTLAAIPQLPKLVIGLSLSDIAVLYIRAGLALFGLALLAFVGWSLFFQTRRKLLSFDKISAAQAQGRPICHCTEDGVLMVLDSNRSNESFWEYVCPKCNAHNTSMSPGMREARKKR
jgi:hypothetical protein